MKKLIILAIVITLALSMAVPALACTPKLEVPSIQVPRIKTVEIKLPGGFWDNWFAKHPITFKVP